MDSSSPSLLSPRLGQLSSSTSTRVSPEPLLESISNYGSDNASIKSSDQPKKNHKTEYKSKFTPFDQYAYNQVTDSFVKQSSTLLDAQQNSCNPHISLQLPSSRSNQDLASPDAASQVVSTHDHDLFEPANGAENSANGEPWYKEVVRRNEKANEYRFKSEVGHQSPLINYTRSESPYSASELRSTIASPIESSIAGGNGGDLTPLADMHNDQQSECQQQQYRFTARDYKRDHLIAHMANNNNFALPKDQADPHDIKARGAAHNLGARSATRSAAQVRSRSQSTRRQPQGASVGATTRPQPTAKSNQTSPVKATSRVRTTTTSRPSRPTENSTTSTMRAANSTRTAPVATRTTSARPATAASRTSSTTATKQSSTVDTRRTPSSVQSSRVAPRPTTTSTRVAPRTTTQTSATSARATSKPTAPVAPRPTPVRSTTTTLRSRPAANNSTGVSAVNRSKLQTGQKAAPTSNGASTAVKSIKTPKAMGAKEAALGAGLIGAAGAATVGANLATAASDEPKQSDDLDQQTTDSASEQPPIMQSREYQDDDQGSNLIVTTTKGGNMLADEIAQAERNLRAENEAKLANTRLEPLLVSVTQSDVDDGTKVESAPSVNSTSELIADAQPEKVELETISANTSNGADFVNGLAGGLISAEDRFESSSDRDLSSSDLNDYNWRNNNLEDPKQDQNYDDEPYSIVPTIADKLDNNNKLAVQDEPEQTERRAGDTYDAIIHQEPESVARVEQETTADVGLEEQSVDTAAVDANLDEQIVAASTDADTKSSQQESAAFDNKTDDHIPENLLANSQESEDLINDIRIVNDVNIGLSDSEFHALKDVEANRKQVDKVAGLESELDSSSESAADVGKTLDAVDELDDKVDNSSSEKLEEKSEEIQEPAIESFKLESSSRVELSSSLDDQSESDSDHESSQKDANESVNIQKPSDEQSISKVVSDDSSDQLVESKDETVNNVTLAEPDSAQQTESSQHQTNVDADNLMMDGFELVGVTSDERDRLMKDNIEATLAEMDKQFAPSDNKDESFEALTVDDEKDLSEESKSDEDGEKPAQQGWPDESTTSKREELHDGDDLIGDDSQDLIDSSPALTNANTTICDLNTSEVSVASVAQVNTLIENDNNNTEHIFGLVEEALNELSEKDLLKEQVEGQLTKEEEISEPRQASSGSEDESESDSEFREQDRGELLMNVADLMEVESRRKQEMVEKSELARKNSSPIPALPQREVLLSPEHLNEELEGQADDPSADLEVVRSKAEQVLEQVSDASAQDQSGSGNLNAETEVPTPKAESELTLSQDAFMTALKSSSEAAAELWDKELQASESSSGGDVMADIDNDEQLQLSNHLTNSDDEMILAPRNYSIPDDSSTTAKILNDLMAHEDRLDGTVELADGSSAAIETQTVAETLVEKSITSKMTLVPEISKTNYKFSNDESDEELDNLDRDPIDTAATISSTPSADDLLRSNKVNDFLLDSP